jgi:MFS family permease
LLCAAATGVFLFLHSQHPRKSEAKVLKQNQSSTEERRLWRQVLVWAGFYTVVTFFMTVGRTFVPTFLAEQVKLNEFYVGLFGSINFAGMTFIGIAMGRLGDRWRKSRAISLCLLLYAVSMVPLLLASEPTVLMFTAFFYGGSIVTASLVSSFVGTIAPEHKRGLWVSVPQTLGLFASFIAPYMGGYVYTISPFYVFLASVIPMPILMLFGLTMLKE